MQWTSGDSPPPLKRLRRDSDLTYWPYSSNNLDFKKVQLESRTEIPPQKRAKTLLWPNLSDYYLSGAPSPPPPPPPAPERPSPLFLAHPDFVRPFLTLLEPTSLINLQKSCRSFCHVIDVNRHRLRKFWPYFVDLEFRPRAQNSSLLRRRRRHFVVTFGNVDFNKTQRHWHHRFSVTRVDSLIEVLDEGCLELKDNTEKTICAIRPRKNSKFRRFEVLAENSTPVKLIVKTFVEFLTLSANFKHLKVRGGAGGTLKALGAACSSARLKIEKLELHRLLGDLNIVKSDSLLRFIKQLNPQEMKTDGFPSNYFDSQFFSNVCIQTLRKFEITPSLFDTDSCGLNDENLCGWTNLRRLDLRECRTELTTDGLLDWICARLKTDVACRLSCIVVVDFWSFLVAGVYRKGWNLQNMNAKMHRFKTAKGRQLRIRRGAKDEGCVPLDVFIN